MKGISITRNLLHDFHSLIWGLFKDLIRNYFNEVFINYLHRWRRGSVS